MLIVDAQNGRLTSAHRREATAPLLLDTRRRSHGTALEFLYRFALDDVWSFTALLDELARGAIMTPPPSASVRDIADAAAFGIASGRIQVASALTDDSDLSFDRQQPRGEAPHHVIFPSRAVARRFLDTLDSEASRSLRDALTHEVGVEEHQRLSVWNPAIRPDSGYGRWSLDQVSSVLAYDRLLMLPYDWSGNLLRLAWAHRAAGGAGETETGGAEPPPVQARPPRPPPDIVSSPPPTVIDVPIVGPVINPATLVVVVPKTYTTPARQQITLTTDADFDGKGRMAVANGGLVKFFDAAQDGNQLAAGGFEIFDGAPLTAGITLFVEGVTASSAMNDVKVTLSLHLGSKNKRPPVSMTITVVDLQLDVCKSRATVGGDRPPFSQDDKNAVGRFVHRQIDRVHGRARLIVQPVKPPDFTGTLTLASTAGGGGLTLWQASDDIPTAGQTQLADPFEFPASSVGSELDFFTEGSTTSTALRDTGWKLGVKDVEADVDHVTLTVCEFSNLVANVPTTKANTDRLNNAPPDFQTLTIGSPTATFSDFTDTLDNPLLLIAGSLPPTQPVTLSVNVAPQGTPVLWSARRDTRAAPQGDSPDLAGLGDNPVPTLNAGADGLSAVLVSDAVGCFHVCPYVDCNDNAIQDFNDPDNGQHIDREPYIMLGYVLIRAQASFNTSRAQDFNSRVTPAKPTSATGVGYGSGTFADAPHAAVVNDAVVTVIGGGRDGRFGLDRVFAGWCNNVTAMDSVVHYVVPATATTPEIAHDLTALMATNAVAAASGNINGRTVPTIFVPAGASTTGTPPRLDVPAAATALPALDVSPFADAGTGGGSVVGTEGPTLPRPHVPISKTPLPTLTNPGTLGEDWRVEMFDSPGFGAGAHHPVIARTVLRSFSFNVDFLCDLCVWTNAGFVPGPSSDPACQLYSVVQENTWQIRFDISFDPAQHGAGTVGNQSTNLTADSVADRVATPVGDSGLQALEVRFPTALSMWSQDATT